MTNDNNSSERLSMRKSMLVWVGGIFLGWGIAAGLIFAYWAMSRQEPIKDIDGDRPPMLASTSKEAKGLNEVMPAAGTAKPAKKTEAD